VDLWFIVSLAQSTWDAGLHHLNQEVGLFINQYLIKTWALTGLSIIILIITGLCVFRTIKSNKEMDIKLKREITSDYIL